MTDGDTSENNSILEECLSDILIQQLSEPCKRQKRRTKSRKNSQPAQEEESNESSQDASELAEFVQYLSAEIFENLPEELQNISYTAIRNDEHLAAKYDTPLSPSAVEEILSGLGPTVTDSFTAYNLSTDHSKLLAPLLNNYIATATQAPPSSNTLQRAKACELCEREHIPLTYHHLIPRDVHAKVLKRGWHEEWRLADVAWLCRACHSMVHRVASTEELAREYYTVDKLKEREDVRRFAAWIAKIRWKAK